MTADWATLGSLVAGAGAGASIGYFWWTSRARATRRKKLDCPFTGHAVDVVVVRDRRTGRWIDVRRCSSAAAGTIRCHHACLATLNDGAIDIESSPSRADDDVDLE